jgi:protein involved in sex pheromone biosynthesis
MKKILSIMLIISLVFLIACQPVVDDTTEDSTETVTETASSEETEISEALNEIEDLESLEDDLAADFEELENLDFE